MKWVRINETWYQSPLSADVQELHPAVDSRIGVAPIVGLDFTLAPCEQSIRIDPMPLNQEVTDHQGALCRQALIVIGRTGRVRVTFDLDIGIGHETVIENRGNAIEDLNRLRRQLGGIELELYLQGDRQLLWWILPALGSKRT